MLTKKTKLNEEETSLESAEYDGLSRAKKEVNPLGQVTLHRYQANQQQSTFEPTGLVSTVIWDGGGLLIEKEERSAEGAAKNTFIYDNSGRVCMIEKEEGDNEYLVYDEHDRVRFHIDSLLRITQNIYDSNNRLTHKLRYSSVLPYLDERVLKRKTWSPTGDYCIESTLYNSSGQLICSINGDHYVTEHRYDSVGNQIKTIEYTTALNLTQEQRTTLTSLPELKESKRDRLHQYFYNEAHQLIGEQIPLGQVIAYERTVQGELLNKRTTLAALPVMTDWDDSLVTSVPYKTECFKLDARGQCLEQINAEQNATTNRFDAAGRIIELSFGGETEVSTWDVSNRLTNMQHSMGLELTKSYSPCGSIACETKRDLIAGTDPRGTHLRYNGFGQVTHELTPRAALKLSDPAFIADSSLVEALWKNESVRHVYNLAGLKRSTQDELGNTSYFYYNTAHELCFSINPTGTITEYTQEALFQQNETTRYYALCLEEEVLDTLNGGVLTPELIDLFHHYQSEDDAFERTQYNKRGFVSLTVDAEHFATQKEYDAFNNITVLQQQIDEEHQLVTHMDYDKASRPLIKIQDVGGVNATESWVYRDDESLVLYKDANKKEHKTWHDVLNRKIKELDPLDRETTFAWDALSRPTQTTNALLHTTTISYTNHGRTISTSTPLSSSVIEKNAFGEIEMEKYAADDKAWKKTFGVDGEVETKTDPDGHSHTYGYNVAGWLTNVLDPLNKTTVYKHNKSGGVEQQIEIGLNEEHVMLFKRDSQGREVLRTDANKVPTQTFYDKRGLETDKIIDPEGLALRTHNDYDGLKNLVKEIKGSRDYPEQLITQTVRDNLGRERHHIISPDGLNLSDETIHDAVGNCIATIDSNQHQSRFCYDAANQQRYIIDPMGGVIEKSYDAKGRCIEERHYSIPLLIEEIDEFTVANIEALLSPRDEDKVRCHAYDADDNLIENLDEHGKLTTSKYNAQGKKIKELQYATPLSNAEFKAGTKRASHPKDRQSAWFYDGRGNERFAMNGEGIVTEHCWNEKGWLIEERTFARAYFDYEHCPSRETLAHPDDRATHYLHDVFGRVIFEINAEGYVTEHEYKQGDEPTCSWFYPKKIQVPQTCNLISIRELLPTKDNIPSIKLEYDTAYRKTAAIDQLEEREEFKLDALGNLREHIDKGGNSWIYTFDAADRKTEEATPPVEVNSVNQQGQLIKSPTLQRIIQKTEYHGDMLRITEAYGTADARSVEFYQNPCKQTVEIRQEGVSVYDNTQIPTKILEDYAVYVGEKLNHSQVGALINQSNNTQIRPEEIKTLSTKTLYNTYKKPIVIWDEAGNARFKIYEGDKIRYEVDQEGFVTGYEYNVYANVIKLTRYAQAIKLDWNAFINTGIPLSIIAGAIRSSTEEDRSIFFEFDNANRPTSTTQDRVFVYVPQGAGEAQHGEYSPVKMNEYNAFGEVDCIPPIIPPNI
jgi:YD repeat-containing protein